MLLMVLFTTKLQVKMRTYSFVKGVFRCDIEYRNNVGSLEYDFNLGIFHAEKPSGVPSFVWLAHVFNFAKLASKFVRPIKEDELL